MKVTFNHEILDLDGEPVKVKDEKGEDSALTLKDVCINVLMSEIPEEAKKETGKDKLKRFKLAEKIHCSDELDLTAEKITLLKERIGKMYSTLVVGRAYGLLDGTADDSEDEDK